VLDEPEKKKEEEADLMPTEYSCSTCTFLNSLSQSNCTVCEQPAPPMAEIMAEFKRNLVE